MIDSINIMQCTTAIVDRRAPQGYRRCRRTARPGKQTCYNHLDSQASPKLWPTVNTNGYNHVDRRIGLTQ